MRRSVSLSLVACWLVCVASASAADRAAETFEREIQPLLDQYCYDCHGYGSDKGGVKLDGFENAAALRDHKLWLRALKNVRAGIMPPANQPKPSADEVARLIEWIKRDAFELDPAQPDPGRVTVRRLNRVEYRNTIRELTGVDYDTKNEFPADDTGHGFDNIGDVLTISPMLMEKYLDAAQAVVSRAVPTQPRVPAETRVAGRSFAERAAPPAEIVQAALAMNASAPAPSPGENAKRPVRPRPQAEGRALDLSYYTPVTVAVTHRVEHAGKYQLAVDLRAIERYVDDLFDYNRCRVIFRADGDVLLDREFVRESDKGFQFAFDRDWAAGAHELSFEIQPIGPDQPQHRLLRIRLNGVTVRGPLEEEHWVPPPGYARFFPRSAPADPAERRAYAVELLQQFASRAFRRPVDEPTVRRLAEIAEGVYSEAGNTFEYGVAQAMVAVLASPRFVFREEDVEPLQPGQVHPLIDEYALASRLSYFLWSSMPDDELFRLAGERRLRAELPAQMKRMLADPRSKEFVRNFAGQWLQARDITTVAINAIDLHLREHPNPAVERARDTFRRIVTIPEEKRTPEEALAFKEARSTFRAFARQPKPQLSDELREAMQAETEAYFEHVIQDDRSLLELIDSNYTFLNEQLARHYDVPGVEGKEIRKVTLPADSPRGGVLTQGTVLTVTSNPTRTSPVKRGVFVLEAILGTPPAPPPPNIPSLEDAASPEKLAQMSLRETLALHASNKMCASCHSRMDPLGLALENFNAMGKWRTSEMNQPIEPAGKLITGESFADIRELKRILATDHRHDFYHAMTEKMLTYALGRGVEYYDTDTLDAIVAQLEEHGGRPSVLLRGIVESAAFQQRREESPAPKTDNLAASHASAP
ncbi:MAG TPA: DUF1592 domain-containing protein [Opitutus sp.]|nr:DUF1592 domain-containing protein [Opitutus sp.]